MADQTMQMFVNSGWSILAVCLPKDMLGFKCFYKESAILQNSLGSLLMMSCFIAGGVQNGINPWRHSILSWPTRQQVLIPRKSIWNSSAVGFFYFWTHTHRYYPCAKNCFFQHVNSCEACFCKNLTSFQSFPV